jgi:hypothetical protein
MLTMLPAYTRTRQIKTPSEITDNLCSFFRIEGIKHAETQHIRHVTPNMTAGNTDSNAKHKKEPDIVMTAGKTRGLLETAFTRYEKSCILTSIGSENAEK